VAEGGFAGWRGFRATAGLTSLLGVLLKKSSNINQKTPPEKTRRNNWADLASVLRSLGEEWVLRLALFYKA